MAKILSEARQDPSSMGSHFAGTKQTENLLSSKRDSTQATQATDSRGIVPSGSSLSSLTFEMFHYDTAFSSGKTVCLGLA